MRAHFKAMGFEDGCMQDYYDNGEYYKSRKPAPHIKEENRIPIAGGARCVSKNANIMKDGGKRISIHPPYLKGLKKGRFAASIKAARNCKMVMNGSSEPIPRFTLNLSGRWVTKHKGNGHGKREKFQSKKAQRRKVRTFRSLLGEGKSLQEGMQIMEANKQVPYSVFIRQREVQAARSKVCVGERQERNLITWREWLTEHGEG